MRISDWSSDVCSSDLRAARDCGAEPEEMPALQIADRLGLPPLHAEQVGGARHVDIEEGAPHQEIARLGGDILRALGQPLRRDRARQAALAPAAPPVEIGRASCRERGCQYVSFSVVAVSLKKKKK